MAPESQRFRRHFLFYTDLSLAERRRASVLHGRSAAKERLIQTCSSRAKEKDNCREYQVGERKLLSAERVIGMADKRRHRHRCKRHKAPEACEKPKYQEDASCKLAECRRPREECGEGETHALDTGHELRAVAQHFAVAVGDHHGAEPDSKEYRSEFNGDRGDKPPIPGACGVGVRHHKWMCKRQVYCYGVPYGEALWVDAWGRPAGHTSPL